MNDEQGREKGKLGMPEHIARERLLEAPETKQIAEALGVDVEAYVDRVMYYAKNPEASPEFHIVPDEDLAEAGVDVASFADVKAWFDGVEAGEIDVRTKKGMEDSDGFGTQPDEAERVRQQAGFQVERRAPKQEELAGKVEAPKGGAGSALAEQLRAQQRATRLQMDAQRSKKKE